MPLIPDRGEPIWARIAGSAEFSAGKPVRLVAAFADVTQRVAERNALQAANERVRLATDGARIGIYEWDVVDGRLTWNDPLFALHGLMPSDGVPTYEQWRRFVHPDDVAVIDAVLAETQASGKPVEHEFRIVWRDGSVRHLRATGQARCDADGRIVRCVGAVWDITEPRRLATELAEQHELLRVTLDSIGDAVITTDARENITWLNPVAERLTGWSAAAAAGKGIAAVFNVLDEETGDCAPSPVSHCLKNGTASSAPQHLLLISNGGASFGIEGSAAPIRSARGELLGAVLVFRDVTEARRLSGEVRYRASHDGLTGLLNRTEFELRLNALLRAANAAAAAHAMLYIDLDEFKVVNDSCGHAAGDELLGAVAQLLAKAVRSGDTLARLGGDEFAIVLEQCSTAQAERVAQLICDQMNAFRYVNDSRRFRIGASIGVVPIDSRWATAAAILQAADSACYAAKEAGRNRFRTWVETDRAIRERRAEMQWTTRIERALDEDRFVLFAQRIAAATRSSGIHAEVLLRMLADDGSLIAPGVFLPAAERFHLAERIDRYVVAKTIAWLAALPESVAVDALGVNVSGQSVGDPAFHRWAVQTLSAAGPTICSRLCFEITETAAITNLAGAIGFIEYVRSRNVRVALDDFGAGASSFGYLKSIPVDLLKIDGQFVKNVIADPLDAVTVACFVDVARVVGIKTVAECVESPHVLAHLADCGVDFFQGFHVHRPAPIGELLDIGSC